MRRLNGTTTVFPAQRLICAGSFLPLLPPPLFLSSSRTFCANTPAAIACAVSLVPWPLTETWSEETFLNPPISHVFALVFLFHPSPPPPPGKPHGQYLCVMAIRKWNLLFQSRCSRSSGLFSILPKLAINAMFGLPHFFLLGGPSSLYSICLPPRLLSKSQILHPQQTPSCAFFAPFTPPTPVLFTKIFAPCLSAGRFIFCKIRALATASLKLVRQTTMPSAPGILLL